MKNGYLLTGLVFLLVVGGAGLFVVLGTDNNNSTGNQTLKAATNYLATNACDALTLAEAKKLLGAQASSGNNTPAVTASDVQVTSCSYTNKATAVSDIRTATVLYRAALNTAGAASNKSGFDANMSTQMVDGYGEHAYWNADLGQLNIHDGNDWIIVSMGGANPKANTLDDAKLVADQVLN